MSQEGESRGNGAWIRYRDGTRQPRRRHREAAPPLYGANFGRTPRLFRGGKEGLPVLRLRPPAANPADPGPLSAQTGDFPAGRVRRMPPGIPEPAADQPGPRLLLRRFLRGHRRPGQRALLRPAARRGKARQARRVTGLAEPRRWLDVGGGNGSFCEAAATVWPGTRFDAMRCDAGGARGARGARGACSAPGPPTRTTAMSHRGAYNHGNATLRWLAGMTPGHLGRDVWGRCARVRPRWELRAGLAGAGLAGEAGGRV